METIIKIPKALHDIHGAVSPLRDVVLAHSLAIASTVTVLVLSMPNLHTWQEVLLGVLTYDLVGGVVANFSHSTSTFYAASPQNRRGFLLLHLLQPTLLTVVFMTHWAVILPICSSS